MSIFGHTLFFYKNVTFHKKIESEFTKILGYFKNKLEVEILNRTTLGVENL